MKEKIVFFTKAPRLGFGKSRLKQFLSEKERYDLCVQLIDENFSVLKSAGYDMEIYFDGDPCDISFIEGIKKEQHGSDLGERMFFSIKEALQSSDKVLLMGSDLYGISSPLIQEAFEKLETKDLVIAPAEDGGYGLIGMKKSFDLFSDIEYSRPDVYEKTIEKAEGMDLEIAELQKVRDIDTLEDLVAAETKARKVRLLGQGEYNINYLCDDSYVIRINLGSQLYLGKKQIPYEYNALKELQPSKAVPKVYGWKERGIYLPLPFLRMEYVKGRPLDYDKDLKTAAVLLSRIHNLPTEGSSLIYEEKPFQSMFEECKTMYSKYKAWDKREMAVIEKIDRFMETAESLGSEDLAEGASIINTELNNRNFIIGENNVVIDWEKPIIGECEQDLAHFMVPTTTNWKTDKILSAEERELFLKEYEQYHPIDHHKLGKYLVFNCLRGLTWSSMAQMEYNTMEKTIVNEDTLEKINYFLSAYFLEFIEQNYYEEYYGNMETK